MMQLGLRFWGGRRAGAGRKRGKNVQHLARSRQCRSVPVLVTLRARGTVGDLRGVLFGEVRRCLSAAKERLGVRIVVFSVQRDHLHLVVEAESKDALSSAMKGLQCRIAKGLNKLLDRSGEVFTDRFHARRLRTPSEIRNSLAYVLLNF